MRVEIYSIQNTLFAGEAEKLIAQTPLGEITVLNNHLPLISTLTGPCIKLVDKKDQDIKIEIVSGFLEIRSESEVVAIVE